jgi:MoaA/NifB/PqqE/SkfB family radical SAM enzyme
MSEQLINCGLDLFEFSLDGADTVTVDSIRKGSNLTTVLENIKVLRDLKKDRKSQIPVINATTVLQRKNYLQLPQIIELADELGIMHLSFNHLEPYKEDMIPNIVWYDSFIPEDLTGVLEKSLELAAQKKICLGIASFFPTTPTCNEVTTPVILANGDVVPCAVLAYDREQFLQVEDNNRIVMKRHNSGQKCFGNIGDTSLKKIWFSREYAQFRRKVLSGDFPDECTVCLIKHNCICVRPGPSAEAVVSKLKEHKSSTQEQ